jgi:hypothetical protein
LPLLRGDRLLYQWKLGYAVNADRAVKCDIDPVGDRLHTLIVQLRCEAIEVRSHATDCLGGADHSQVCGHQQAARSIPEFMIAGLHVAVRGFPARCEKLSQQIRIARPRSERHRPHAHSTIGG